MRRTAALLLLLALPAASEPLRYAEDRAPALVNPVFATTMAEARINELVFAGLFTDDRELRSQPLLVESFTVTPNRRSMKLTMRRDLTWHDAVPLTARDVVFTIEAMKAEGTASPEASRVAWISRAIALHDHSLQLDFEAPEIAPEDKLHFKILPAHRFKSTTLDRADPFRTQPIGAGPFKVDSFNDDNSIAMSRVGAAGPSGILMREVADKNYQAKLLLYESLEALVRVLPRDLAVLESDRSIDLYPYQTNSWWYLGLNTQNPRLADVRVRQALTAMVDVDGLLKPIGTGDRVSGPFVPSSPFYDHDVKPVAYDPDRGARLLNEAGFTFNGREWLGPEGQSLTLRLAVPANMDTAQDVVVNLQSQLSSRGVRVEPEFLPVAEWKARVWRDRSFDLILSQWSFDRNEDVYDHFHSTGRRNFTSYASPEVDALLDAARTTTDPQEKKARLREAHAKIAADAPMVFLFTLDSYAAMSARVKDVVVHPFYFFTWVEGWRLE
ncbi:MAG: ABC transporter substrate-binding protein [Myxococcota bacterium]